MIIIGIELKEKNNDGCSEVQFTNLTHESNVCLK